ncbi:MAG: hypothetical protein L3J65_05100 [Robiginitomaculum sp.]|nr:hypothetical protein [Robiginitomaculum sp.]
MHRRSHLLVLTVIGLVGVGIAFVVSEYFEKENIHSLFVVVFLMPFFIGSAYYEKFIAKDFGILWKANNIPNLENSKSKGRTMSFYQVLLMGITAAPLIVFHLQLNKLAIGNIFFSPLILTFDSFLIAYLSITMGVATWLAYCRVYSDGLPLNDSYAKSTQPPNKISDLT